MKKIFILLATLLLATIAMAYFYFTNLHSKNNANELALNAVSNHCGLIFTYDNDKSFYEILAGQNLLQEALGIDKAKQLRNLSVFVKNQAVFNALEGQKTYIGLSADEEGVNYLLSLQLKPDLNPALLLKAINDKNVTIRPNGDTYQVDFADSSRVFLSIRKDLVVVSNRESEVNARTNPNNNTEFQTFITDNNRFNKNTLANLYINFDQIPPLLKSLVTGSISGELSAFNQQKTFAALTYNFSKNKLLFNGNTLPEDEKNYYRLFVNLPGQPLKIDDIFPSSTANYITYSVNDYAKWQVSLQEWMANNQKEQEVKKQISKIEQQYRVNLQQVLPKYFKNQFATFQLHTGEKFGVVGLSNGEKVNQLLIDLSSDYAPDIKIFKEPLLPFIYFGEPFKKFERPFYTIVDNYLVIANNASSVQSFLRSYRSNSLLINETTYTEFREQLSDEATVCFYVNTKNSNDLFARNLKAPFFKEYQSKSGYKSYNAFSYQMVGDKGKFLTNCLLYKSEEKPADSVNKTAKK